MNFVAEETSLVVVGAWNRSILSPDWIARHVFGTAEPVEVQFQVSTNLWSDSARFILLGLAFVVTANRLEVRPVDRTPAGLALAERTIRTILQRLPHTPVRGVGFNFGCDESDPTEAMLNTFSVSQDLAVLDFAYDLSETKVTTSLSFEGRVLNLTRSFANGVLKLRFNFHHAFATAEAAGEALRDADGLFLENYDYFRRVMRQLYGNDMNPLMEGQNGD